MKQFLFLVAFLLSAFLLTGCGPDKVPVLTFPDPPKELMKEPKDLQTIKS